MERGFAWGNESATVLDMASSSSTLPTCFTPQEPLGENIRFIAVDVETAGYDSASICQIGLAVVGFDNAIATFSSYIDPCTLFAAGNTRLHGIDAETVKNAPNFKDVLPDLRQILEAYPLVQHSRFDEKAFDAACRLAGHPVLLWRARPGPSCGAMAGTAWPTSKRCLGCGFATMMQAKTPALRHRLF
jgi:DNA polymerase-3 subunit epsilon